MTKIKLTADDVKHVAKLSRLELTDEEIEKYAKQLSTILGYINKLNELDTSKVEPTSQVTDLKNILRNDVAQKSLSQKEALSSSKNTKDGYFKVKHALGS